MPSSFQETISLPCPRCGQPFQAAIWLIVDAAERPDLLEKIQAGTLHQVTCPHCNFQAQADAPLLLLRRDGQPPLLFSPAQQTTAEQDQEHARALVTHLRDGLGAAWQDDWLAGGLPGVPRPLLPVILNNDPEAGLAQIVTQAQEELKRLREEDPETYRQLEEQARQMIASQLLLETLQAFLQADTWNESRRIVEQHPELLGQEADELLTQLIQAAKNQGDQNVVGFLQEHQELLRVCRVKGISQAFAEKMGVSPEDLEAANALAQLPPEALDVLEELARSGVEIRTPEDLQRALENRPDLRQKLEAAVRRPPSAVHIDIPPELRPIVEEIAQLRRLSEMPRKVELCEQSMRRIECENHPVLWAALQVELANALVQNPLGHRAENLEQAIFHYQQALEVLTRQAYPEQWAGTQNNLGEAYRNRIRGERAENLEQAIFHYQQALEVYTRQAYPVECRQTARNLGNLAFEQGNWELACAAYAEAWLAQELLLRAASLRSSKEAELQEMAGIPARLVYAHLRLGNLTQALEALEAGRARLLGEALERSRRDLERLVEIGQGALLERYRRADERVQALQGLAATPNRPPDWLVQMEQAQAEWNAVIEDIRRLPGYETFLRSLTAEQIQAQAADAPLVYLAATPQGGFALLVRTQGEPLIVELPDLTEESLQKQVWGFSAKEYQALQEQTYKENRQPPSQAELLGGYLGAYFRWRASLRPGTPKTEQESARQAWFDALESTLRWMGQAVMAPVLGALAAILPQDSLVRLVPGGLLALLPLHAAILTVDRGPQTAVEQAADRKPHTAVEPSAVSRQRSIYALDHYTFAYTPSAQALYHARPAANHPADSLLAVDNPDGTLVFSEMEIAEARRHFPDHRHLPKAKATLKAVRQALPAHAVLHFSTHGWAGWREDETSGLKLADGNLYLRDLFDLRLERARLGILSACESGLPGIELLEEVVSLPATMMQAGVPGVLGSLWAVNDLSTAMLIARFYENWRERGLDLPHALRAKPSAGCATCSPMKANWPNWKPNCPKPSPAALPPNKRMPSTKSLPCATLRIPTTGRRLRFMVCDGNYHVIARRPKPPTQSS